jgi:thiol-disulfide isomerase/thioredoxin
MKNKLSRIILSILIVLAAGWGVRQYMRKTVTPEMSFKDNELLITSGNTKTSINDLKGNVTIISFFQTWCGHCAQEIPVLNDLAATLNSTQFKILCISDEDSVRINTYRGRFEAANILFAHSPESLANLGIHVYPTTYLLNKKGEVVRSKLEGYNWGLEKETIEKLLGE